jgi:hypothetical protein
MPPKSGKWIGRIKDVEQEFRVGRLAARLLRDHLRVNPVALAAERLRHRDAAKFQANLEQTYLVRLYAEFEAGLREAWRVVYGRTTFPKMEVLIDRVAALRDIPPELIRAVHEVREYRNDVVHDAQDGMTPVPIDQARHRLCAFFSRLPRNW